MTILLARLRQAARWAWALLIPVGAYLVYTFARRRKPALPNTIDEAVARYRRAIDEANARAAVQIAMARAKNAGEVAELAEVLRDASQGEDEQVDRMIAVGKKIREE